LNDIGRLDSEDRKELDQIIDEIHKLISKNYTKKAEKKLVEIAKTPNYFIREYLGKHLSNCEKIEHLEKIANNMISHKLYGVRATALFFLNDIYKNKPQKLFQILGKTYATIPWEVETVVDAMWRKYPTLMKEEMLIWVEDEDEKKRALSFHGMDNIARDDTNYIMNFVSKAIDDESMEVQKKITHILTQVVRVNPIVVFPYMREWLLEANDQRIKTIWVSMKKLSNIVVQRARRDKEQELVVLTKQTVIDWKNDDDKKVAEMGKKLYKIIKQK